MIKHFIAKAQAGKTGLFRRPKIVISVPSGSTQVERRALRTAALGAGAANVALIEESMAAAIGAGLPVTEPQGVSYCWFRGHRDKVFFETGGWQCNDGSSAATSSLRR